MWLFVPETQQGTVVFHEGERKTVEWIFGSRLEICRPEQPGLPGTQPGATLQGPSNPPWADNFCLQIFSSYECFVLI